MTTTFTAYALRQVLRENAKRFALTNDNLKYIGKGLPELTPVDVPSLDGRMKQEA